MTPHGQPPLKPCKKTVRGSRIAIERLTFGRIKQTLTNWRVGPPATLNDREVQVVQGTTAGGATATMCFDAESGLLVRLVRFSESPVGRIVTQVQAAVHRYRTGVKPVSVLPGSAHRVPRR